MKPEDHQAQKRAQLLKNIAQERIIELKKKADKAWQRCDMREFKRLSELIEINQRVAND
jgi:hypothetical protein